MKKLMKKIKSNKLISKLVALTTICMVLLSSLSVSAFAADDEVSAANEETESITDVWTDVMNWITSSLSSAQGVFVSSDSSFTIFSDQWNEYFTDNSYQYYAVLPGLDTSSAVIDEYYTFLINGSPVAFQYIELFSDSGSLLAYAFYNETSSAIFVCYLDDFADVPLNTWLLVNSEPSSTPITISFPFGGVSLTFLGTFAVIGVAIAIAFLLIALISRFLRLRG